MPEWLTGRFAKPYFVRSIRTVTSNFFMAPQNKSITEKLLSPSGSCRASIKFSEKKAFYSSKEKRLTCETFFSSNDTVAVRWIRLHLKKHRALFDKGVFLQLPANQRSILPDLARLGSRVHSVIYGGNSRVALGTLRKKYGHLSWQQNTFLPGLEITPLCTEFQVREVMKIIKTEFTRHPEFGWFVASREYLTHETKQLNRQRKTREPMNYVIMKNGKILGEYGFELSKRNGKKTASLALNFSREIQGHGLSKIAYQHILQRMIEMKIETFSGGTSQKPVMKLATIMKRPVVSYSLKPGRVFFRRNYFP